MVRKEQHIKQSVDHKFKTNKRNKELCGPIRESSLEISCYEDSCGGFNEDQNFVSFSLHPDESCPHYSISEYDTGVNRDMGVRDQVVH